MFTKYLHGGQCRNYMALYLDRFNSEELTKCRDARPLVFSLNLVMIYLCFTFINIFKPAFTVDRHKDSKIQIPMSNNTILCI